MKRYNPATILGGTSRKDAEDCLQRFSNDVTCRVFVGSLQAAGEGLTLVAASHAVLVEPSWVPGDIAQAADRCHRIGTTDPVLVDLLTVQESIDAKMLWRCLEKLDTIEAMLPESPATEETFHMSGLDHARIASLYEALAKEFRAAAGKPARPATVEPEATKTDTDIAQEAAKAEVQAATMGDVRKAAAVLIQKRKQVLLRSILAKFDAAKVSELSEEQYPEFVQACREGAAS